MLRRLRELLTTPFARPPGRRSVWARFAPEWCAAGAYTLAALAAWLVGALGQNASLQAPVPLTGIAPFSAPQLLWAATAAYTLMGLALVIFPVYQAAMALAGERSRGTMDALRLVPADHSRMALGRFWSTLGPWARLWIYMLPLYFLLAGGGLSQWVDHDASFLYHVTLLSLPKWLFAYAELNHLTSTSCWAWLPGSSGLVLLRAFNDAAILFLAVSAAFLISARSRTSAQALTRSFLVIPAGLVTVMCLDGWLLLVGELAWHWERYTAYKVAYCSLAILLLLGRPALGWLLLRKAARDFDARGPGDGPEDAG